MSRDRFDFLWRNIHISDIITVDEYLNPDVTDKTNQKNSDGEIIPESDWARQEFVEEDLDTPPAEEEQDDSNDDEEEEEEDTDWYAKAKRMLDHVNALSKEMCLYPGTALSIDEMMKLFKGRSVMTHRMKKKPNQRRIQILCPL